MRMKNIVDHFKKNDPILHAVIPDNFDTVQRKEIDFFIALCESIVSQQLSIKAADTIFARFKVLFPTTIPTPELTTKLSIEQLRAVGLSNAKANYIKDLAQKVYSKEIDLDHIKTLSNEEVITELTKVKGIGRWTAEMFLMFALGREDIFSYGDLGLRKAIQKLYKLKKEPTPTQAEKIAKKWIPYRTYACRILWKSLDS